MDEPPDRGAGVVERSLEVSARQRLIADRVMRLYLCEERLHPLVEVEPCTARLQLVDRGEHHVDDTLDNFRLGAREPVHLGAEPAFCVIGHARSRSWTRWR